MIKRLLVLDGVDLICHFRDDGSLVEGYGLMDQQHIVKLAQFAHGYRRMVQGHADQLAMFTGMRGWTPPRGWIIRGNTYSACCIANLVCIVRNTEGALNEILAELQEVARW
jgi:roadblock/LC7 domain-containing protein